MLPGRLFVQQLSEIGPLHRKEVTLDLVVFTTRDSKTFCDQRVIFTSHMAPAVAEAVDYAKQSNSSKLQLENRRDSKFQRCFVAQEVAHHAPVF